MKKLLFGLFSIMLFGISAFSQNAYPGKPETINSFTLQSVDLSQKNTGNNALVEIQKPNLATIVAQDAVNDSKEAYRVGVNIPSNLNMTNSGTWSVSENGVKVWKLKIHSDDAQALGLYYSDVTLPVGSKLFLYNENKAQVIGAFTSQTPDIKATEMIEGETLTIEYNEPVGVTGTPNIQISQVVYFYRGVEDRIGAYRDYQQITPKADACQVNVACSESTGWEDQVDAVVHYTFSSGGGTFVCSASLINNTSEDCTPYILTATHCGEVTTNAGLNNHVWYFNYQNPNCVPGATAQYPKPSSTATGGIFRASSMNTWNNATAGNNQVFGTDFTLVELPSGTTLPTNAFFAGWDRSTTASPSGVGIHHPAGHDKKISTYTGSLSSTTYNGGITNAHWLVTWNATTNGHGVTEGGSSGSPIFNNNGLIVGMLSGGSSFCTNTGAPDLYGKIDVSWDPSGAAADGRLKDWLDPTNTGAMTQNGIQTPCSPQVPVADFAASNTNPLEGATILLSDLTTGIPTSWAWTISGTQGTDWAYANSTTATSQNPEVTFNVAGTYDVTLTATNAQGNDTEIKTGYITVTALVCEDPTNTPYTADIQNTDFSQWIVINDNGDTDANNALGGLWNVVNLGFGQANTDSSALLYLYNSDATTAADDWFFTGCIDLVAGNTYDLSFYHRVGGAAYPEDLEMFIGTDQTIAAMTNSVIDLNGLTNTTWTQATGTFTPTTTETYYLGFHCTSAADMWYVAVDDINISFTPSSVVTLTNSPSNTTIDCAASIDPTNTGQLTATTDCADPTVTVNYTDNVSTGSCANAYTITRTWTASDNCGTSESYIQTITVTDNIAPSITCGQATDNITASGATASLPNYVTGATVSDNCSLNGNITVTQAPAANAALTPGNYTVTLTATDECGNTNTCSIAVTINAAPAITITNSPANTTIDCAASTAPSNTGQLTATTTCSNTTVTVNYSDNVTTGSCANASTITRTWTATDNCGNTETYVQTITVADNIAPIITCGQSTDQLNTTGTVALPSYTAGATVSDNCSSNANITVTQSPVAGTQMSPGGYTVVLTATDECGNTNTCSIAVTVINTSGITITTMPPNTTISCDASSAPSNTGTAVAQTTCADPSVTVTFTDNVTTGACANASTITRTWTATDNCGNTETHIQVINIQDIVAPSLTCGQSTDQLNTTSTIALPDYTGGATVTDNCSSVANITITQSPVVGTQMSPGTYTVTLTATDECGNASTCDIALTVIDDAVITLMNTPANITINCDESTAESNTGALTAQTACPGGVQITSNDITTNGNCPGNYTITRTWTVTNGCNTTETYTQIITVQDVTAPTIDCGISQDVVSFDDGMACPDYVAGASATDNCASNITITQSPSIGSTLAVGNNTVTLTATDECGNTSTCDIIVEREDSNVGIEEATTDNIIVLYPNPTNGMFTVELPENNTSVDILDMNGKIIFTQKNIASNKANFSLEGLAKGIYQVKITLSNKVVVKRVSKI